jgi:hypothetical protein
VALVATAVAAVGRAAPPAMTRDEIICRAASAVGFSYYWGGSCWCPDGCSPDSSCSKGSCSGNCPNCTHSGKYGADCSGLVNKVWQVPDAIAPTTCGHGPYVAASYTGTTSNWTVIPRSELEKGDAMASSTHVLIFDHGDPWGQLVAYEARGCSYGIVHNWRSCSSSYSAARRANLSTGCDCQPGDVQKDGCGNCGTRTRACESSCKWGSWSSCAGQGPCAAGATESQPCCDCGSEKRSCDGSCQWGDWGLCAGPDPGGDCPTGEPGPCAAGTRRCVDGCQACVSAYEPEPEKCDTIDNDCNGTVDDGDPSEMGKPPPAYAARLTDGSYPGWLGPGATAVAWATFRNEGAQTWRKGEVWLAAMAAQELEASVLYDAESWPAWDVAAVLDRDVEPGAEARFEWRLRAPAEAGDLVQEGFRLADPEGALLRCPSPELVVAVHIGLGPDGTGLGDDPAAGGGLVGVVCAVSGPATRAGSTGLSWLLLSAIGVLRYRQRRRPSAEVASPPASERSGGRSRPA